MTKIANVYIVYDLDNWPRNLTNNLKFKKCLFGATNTVKNSDDKVAGKAIIFGVDNSASSHSDNRKNYFLRLGSIYIP